MKVACAPLGRLSGTVEDFDDPLTTEQRLVVSQYVDQLREYESGTEQQKVRTDAEQSVLADCGRARQDRVALLILVATATILLVVTRVTRSRNTADA